MRRPQGSRHAAPSCQSMHVPGLSEPAAVRQAHPGARGPWLLRHARMAPAKPGVPSAASVVRAMSDGRSRPGSGHGRAPQGGSAQLGRRPGRQPAGCLSDLPCHHPAAGTTGRAPRSWTSPPGLKSFGSCGAASARSQTTARRFWPVGRFRAARSARIASRRLVRWLTLATSPFVGPRGYLDGQRHLGRPGASAR